MIRLALTSVPFEEPRSSTVQAPPTRSSSAWARETSSSHTSASSQPGMAADRDALHVVVEGDEALHVVAVAVLEEGHAVALARR